MIIQLQVLRFIFVMLIVCSHLSILGFPHFEAGGDSGVAFFFVVSGYLTMLHYGKELKQGDFRHKEYLQKHILFLLNNGTKVGLFPSLSKNSS